MGGHVANECSFQNITLLQAGGHCVDGKGRLAKLFASRCIQARLEFAISDFYRASRNLLGGPGPFSAT